VRLVAMGATFVTSSELFSSNSNNLYRKTSFICRLF
jgi:hypothetical protein